MEPEKVHLSFLRWSLGVHKKSSSIGCWGETGRYPMVYQTIKMTLKYYQRIANLKPGSIIFAALQEQKSLKLPWYNHVESLLKLDELFHMDHVTAYKFLNRNKNNFIETLDIKNDNLADIRSKTLQQFSNHKIIKPIPSKQFRVEYILKILKEHFKIAWETQKKRSIKLSLSSTTKLSPLLKKRNILTL